MSRKSPAPAPIRCALLSRYRGDNAQFLTTWIRESSVRAWTSFTWQPCRALSTIAPNYISAPPTGTPGIQLDDYWLNRLRAGRWLNRRGGSHSGLPSLIALYHGIKAWSL